MMRNPSVDDFVRLKNDVPELQLRRGEVGIVCSLWCTGTGYEVEFKGPGLDEVVRAIVMVEQVELEYEGATHPSVTAAESAQAAAMHTAH